MRAIVTGGAGFIGSRLCQRLLERGDTVTVIDDLSFSTRAGVPNGAAFIEADAADPAIVGRAAAHADVIFHLAAIASVPFSHKDPLSAHRANALTTLACLQAARQVGLRMVNISSAAVYGDAGETQRESDVPHPKSFYGADKLYGEMIVGLFAGTFGVRALSLRPFNVYGPGQMASSGAVVPLLTEGSLKGEELQIDGDGLQTRDYTYVDDVVEAFILAAGAPDALFDGRAYNLARGEGTTVMDVVAALRAAVGEVHVHHREAPPERSGDIRHSRADITRVTEDLGYQPQIDLAEGIRRTVAWWREVSRQNAT